jgi:hypothetical protein
MGQRRRQLLQALHQHARGTGPALARDREHVEAVGLRGESGWVVVGVVRGVGQEFQSVRYGTIGHQCPGLLRPQQEIHGVGTQPGLGVAVAGPQAEPAVEALTVEHEGDRLLQRGSPRRCRLLHGEREAAAGGLFQAGQPVIV